MNKEKLTLVNENTPFLPKNIEYSASLNIPFLQENALADTPGVIVCGTGPTLIEATNIKRIRKLARKGYVVIAVKQAIRLLKDRNIDVKYSFAMDPGYKQLKKTPLYQDVTYIVASSCHPAMFDYIRKAGCNIYVVHSACGASTQDLDEMGLYEKYYPDNKDMKHVMCGGYTVVNRAVAAAEYMGARHIIVAGAPFGWREGADYYAATVTEPASNASGPTLDDRGLVDGRLWYTKADLLPSAVSLAKKAKENPNRFIFIGDSLAASLSRRDNAFLARVMT